MDDWNALRDACRHAGIPVAEFARRNNVDWSHLYRVVMGQRKSVTLMDAVRAFIAEQSNG